MIIVVGLLAAALGIAASSYVNWRQLKKLPVEER
jgi:hypothetical protein